MIEKFWHTGITVENLGEATAQYKKLGFELVRNFEKPEPHAYAAIMEHPNGSGLELWQWLDESHPQVEFIRNHLAFLSDALDEDVQALVEQGYEIVIPKTEGVLVDYSYLRDASGNCIEIAQEKRTGQEDVQV